MIRLFLRAVLMGSCSACIVLSGVSRAAAEDPFYKGKRLTMLINYAPGGPSDIEGRLLARHLAKHIDGQPSIIIQNKDGAGGLVGTNYVGELGPKDGTMVGFFTGAAWKYVVDPEGQRVDFKTFDFVGFQPGNAVYYVRSDLPPGMKVGADILKAQGLVAGGLGIESAKDLTIRLTLEMLGVPFKYVTGYASSVKARLAVQRGEVSLHSESTPAYFNVVEPTMVKTGEVLPIYYDPNYDGATFSVPKVMEGSSIPPFQEFYRKVKGKLPTGPLWDAYRAAIAIDSAMLRTVAMPPGSPKPALDALRAALAQVNTDPEYAEEAMRVMKFVPFYVTGNDVSERARKQMSISPEVRAFVVNYMKAAGHK